MSFIDSKDLTSHELVPGFRARFVHTDEQSIGYVDASKGGILPRIPVEIKTGKAVIYIQN